MSDEAKMRAPGGASTEAAPPPPVGAAAALAAWLRAIHSGGAASAVALACAPDVEVVRYGWGDERDRVAERLRGHEEVAAWIARSPADCRFEVGAPAQLEGEGERGAFTVRYRLEVAGFRGGGAWRFRLNDDGRLASLQHRPDDLDPDIQDDDWRPLVELSLPT